MTNVAIVDYGLCNLGSIRRALEECGAHPTVTSDPHEVARADSVVLPGVGAFGQAMANLRAAGLDSALLDAASRAKPLLGICLGMHLLAEIGTEGGETPGLGLLQGRVTRLHPPDNARVRVPHVGWNDVTPARPCPLFDGIAPGSDFYFVHSYRLEGPDEELLATVDYCGATAAAVGRDNVMAVQFHPEKSQVAGFSVLRNFLAL